MLITFNFEGEAGLDAADLVFKYEGVDAASKQIINQGSGEELNKHE